MDDVNKKVIKMIHTLLSSFGELGLTSDEKRRVLLATALQAFDLFALDHTHQEGLTAEMDDIILCLQERKSNYV